MLYPHLPPHTHRFPLFSSPCNMLPTPATLRILSHRTQDMSYLASVRLLQWMVFLPVTRQSKAVISNPVCACDQNCVINLARFDVDWPLPALALKGQQIWSFSSFSCQKMSFRSCLLKLRHKPCQTWRWLASSCIEKINVKSSLV